MEKTSAPVGVWVVKECLVAMIQLGWEQDGGDRRYRSPGRLRRGVGTSGVSPRRWPVASRERGVRTCLPIQLCMLYFSQGIRPVKRLAAAKSNLIHRTFFFFFA